MIIAIQQPEHMPWLGFFDKMQRCDAYIFLDNVQFKKRYFENRNKILTSNGPQWITVPVVSKGKFTQKINEVIIDNSSNWRRKYLEKIRLFYGKAKYFGEFYPCIEKEILHPYEKLIELNVALIHCLKHFFDIHTPTLFASELVGGLLTGSELILELCTAMNATTYISGPDGKNYLDVEAFDNKKIKLEFHHFQHPVYSQKSNDHFVPQLSALDYLFQTGKRTFN